MKHLIWGLVFLMTSCSRTSHKILHYNIKELTTYKINKNVDQVKKVKEVMSNNNFDIISINEIQYDLPNIPTDKYNTKGRNMSNFISMMTGSNQWNYSFNPANTGLNAKRNSNGLYTEDIDNEKIDRSLADQINFGILPAQYSTGAAFKFRRKDEKVFANLKWKDFNPSIDLSKFKTPNGDSISEDILLFDKNFTDVTIKIDTEDVHLILLHTVPAFHFGNKYSMNYSRNADQLRFLEWYLTGTTDIKVGKLNINPLKKRDYFIAAGDWNTDYTDKKNPGSAVLKSIFNKTNLWNKKHLLTCTGHNFEEKSFKAQLDYIVFSKNIKVLNGGLALPDSKRENFGCFPENQVTDFITPPNMKLIQYNDNDKKCFSMISEKYYNAKKASDHFPIWAEFVLK